MRLATAFVLLVTSVYSATSRTTVEDKSRATIPESAPKNWAVALFPSFDSIDVFGPLNPLWYLAFSRQLNLTLIADRLDPVFVEPTIPSLNTQNSSLWYSVNPTHTYSNPPKDIDVLLIPGGPGSRLLNVSTKNILSTFPPSKKIRVHH